MTWHFYILYSHRSDRYYLGHTNDPAGRLRRHNSHHKGFTGRANDWNIVYTEQYATKREAYARERQVKSWKSRKRIEELIKSGINP